MTELPMITVPVSEVVDSTVDGTTAEPVAYVIVVVGKAGVGGFHKSNTTNSSSDQKFNISLSFSSIV